MQKPEAIVFFDLDGTLLNSQVEVLKSSIDAINQLHKNNIIPMLSTGRTVCEVESIMQQTGIDSIIAMNGQYVVYQGEKIFSNDIDSALIERVKLFSAQQNIPLAYYNEAVMRVSDHSLSTQHLYDYLKQPIPAIDNYIHQTSAIQMLLLFCQQGEDIYRAAFPELNFIRNTPYCVDVFNQGGSKGYGITQLIQTQGFQGIPTYAFGDGLNDIEMFKVVDHPIAMKNSVDPIKALATFITDDNNNDGIAKGLKRANLI
ncbi:Cof-type HAD-IIB family hydrolase [Utexia brackfieldae]|uniref:Cof-type HAD-IIB family hydrolase n=1 Tax=Utexia brackfieldae TaxID=3074108 RepID=UPI00370D942B